jgi:hypothetical protein
MLHSIQNCSKAWILFLSERMALSPETVQCSSQLQLNVHVSESRRNPTRSPIEHLSPLLYPTSYAELTLSGVVSGMVGNEDCQTNEEVRGRYAAKVFSVLRIVCKGLASLHATGLVHGNISLNHIGKYDGKWKIAEMLGVQKAGDVFDPDRFSPSSPPESLAPSQVASTTHQVAFSTDLVVGPAIDTWALGKLAFEALVGDPLVNFDETAEFDDDHAALMDIMHWNDFNLDEVAEKLRRSSVPDLGIDLIRSCLARAPEERPSSEAILSHPVWKELRRQGKMAR